MRDLISVIVTTYNRVDALAAVLRALGRQNDRDFEIVVADDGSGPETAALVASCRTRLGIPLTHVWQEDQGFRLAQIRNCALLAARGKYCIFLDGDCIPRPNFVAIHRALARPGWLVTGNRVLLSKTLTEFALDPKQEPEWWPLSTWLSLRSFRNINRLMPLLRLPLGPLRKLRATTWKKARGCNLGVWRSDLDLVDGFDADFVGWGREDSDLLMRLLRVGIRRKDGYFATGVLHLWHPRADDAAASANDGRLARTLHDERVLATIGISALQAADEPRLRERAA